MLNRLFSSVRPLALAFLGAAIAAAPARAGTYKTITIDGSFGDWAGVPVAHEDPADSTESADYRRIWIANDDEFIYLRFTLERPANPFLSNANLFVDTDADPFTGFQVFVGSELLIQGGAGYDERGGGFNEGGVEGLDWLSAPGGEATEFEVRLSRSARYATDQATVFTGDTIALLLEAEDANYARQETAPDSEGLVYTLEPAPPLLTAPETLVALTGTSWRVLDSGTEPDASWRDLEYDDTGDGWREGNGLFGYSPNAEAYPAPLATPLATAANTVYLRTRFSWNNSPAGLVFAVSNWLSDGAILYLNGAEVRRVRLPEGAIDATTPATGGPAVEGAVEVFGISGSPLVTGENVLAVELHQSAATPADLVLGLSLTATPSYPVQLINADEPEDRTVTAGEAVTLTAEILGTPPLQFEWRKGGVPIPEATGPSLTFDPVLKSDEGTYSLHVSNSGGEVTTREATLTVNVIPITFSDPDLPADLTVFQGGSATFTVSVAGSPPVSYQWLKDGLPISNATEASYTLSSVSPEDAGLYAVEVSNPATPGQLSRAARLTVQADLTPPTISAVVGTPDRVTLTFSEPVDGASAETLSNYGLSDGLTINSVSVSAEEPAVVVLLTSHQTLWTDYTVTVSEVKDRFGNTIASGSTRSFRSSLVVDGNFDDWADVPLAHTDPSEEPAAGTDFQDIWVSNDDQYLFIRFTLYAPGNPGTYLNNIFLDTDPENIGFSSWGIGSELLIQQGAGYQQKNGGFNEGGIEGLDFAMAPTGTGTDFELRISRSARYASDQLPVFVADTIRFFLETENTSFVTTDTAPDVGGLEYTFVPVSPTEPGPLAITLSGSEIILTWPGQSTLQVRDSLTTGSWEDVPEAVSGVTLPIDAEARFYQLVP